MNGRVKVIVWAAALPIALLLIVPSAWTLWKSRQPMPLPAHTWTIPGAQLRPSTLPQHLTPNTVYIPSVAVRMPFHDALTHDGFLALRHTTHSGVHFADGSTLSHGTYLVAAHVNAVDLAFGPFSHLYQVKPGAEIDVTDAHKRVHRYRTIALNYYSKQALPRYLWYPTGRSSLALATCGGPLEHLPPDWLLHYADNVIVHAVPVPSSHPHHHLHSRSRPTS